eukprot:GHRR01027127.1.p1 GENE.GHRR01027127.1~~GHRR01027127.1.p1  ORF type:complete len:113 (-),score=4.67 GHRR01027127.1:264-602(-)
MLGLLCVQSQAKIAIRLSSVLAWSCQDIARASWSDCLRAVLPLFALPVIDALPHYRSISWISWYRMRLDGNYADLGEESQIDWYRLPAGRDYLNRKQIATEHQLLSAGASAS